MVEKTILAVYSTGPTCYGVEGHFVFLPNGADTIANDRSHCQLFESAIRLKKYFILQK